MQIQWNVRLCITILTLSLITASMAQDRKGKLPPAPGPFLVYSLQDYRLQTFLSVDQNFANAPIPAGEKSHIAGALVPELDRAVEEDNLYADVKAHLETGGPTRQDRRKILDYSAILAIAALPHDGHLYIIRIDIPSRPSGGPNSGFEIVEASPLGARFLGESDGWGVAALPRPGQIYPTLMFIAHLGADDAGLYALRYKQGKYVRWRCGHVTEKGLTFGPCQP